MLGRILISLISWVFWDFRARLAFFWASYLNLPTSRNLATGGSAFGDTSTRSRPSSPACSIASRVNITPRFSPFSSITRTLGETINSLKRGPLIGGGVGPLGRRGARGGIVVSPYYCKRKLHNHLCLRRQRGKVDCIDFTRHCGAVTSLLSILTLT